jgi:hypothetical protein
LVLVREKQEHENQYDSKDVQEVRPFGKSVALSDEAQEECIVLICCVCLHCSTHATYSESCLLLDWRMIS